MSPRNRETIKLAADAMLGRTAAWLRLMGLDVIFLRDGPVRVWPDRVLITNRSTRPHQPSLRGWARVIRLESNDHRSRLRELIRLLPLSREEISPFTRCSRCNLPLSPLAPSEATGKVPDYVLTTQAEFARCPGCDRVYWPGGHQERMTSLLEDLWSD